MSVSRNEPCLKTRRFGCRRIAPRARRWSHPNLSIERQRSRREGFFILRGQKRADGCGNGWAHSTKQTCQVFHPVASPLTHRRGPFHPVFSAVMGSAVVPFFVMAPKGEPLISRSFGQVSPSWAARNWICGQRKEITRDQLVRLWALPKSVGLSAWFLVQPRLGDLFFSSNLWESTFGSRNFRQPFRPPPLRTPRLWKSLGSLGEATPRWFGSADPAAPSSRRNGRNGRCGRFVLLNPGKSPQKVPAFFLLLPLGMPFKEGIH